jgi:hypothetical protein
MQDLRKAAMAATLLSVLTITLALLSRSFGWPVQIDRFQSIVVTLIGVGSGICAVAFWCTYITICSLRKSTAEMICRVTAETKALHRSMVVTMEQYGDARAIDAVLLNERRHALNGRASEETVDLTQKSSNVTELHKHR